MRLFGWSYPAGCSGPPDDETPPCEICGRDPDTLPDFGGCLCPECEVCGSVGDPDCYEAHGLVRSPEQVASLAEFTAEDRDPGADWSGLDED